jgi:hypothetical protein
MDFSNNMMLRTVVRNRAINLYIFCKLFSFKDVFFLETATQTRMKVANDITRARRNALKEMTEEEES